MRTNLRFSLHSAHFFSVPSHAIPCTKYHQDCLMLALTQEEHETFKALNNHHPYIETVVTALVGQGRKKKGMDVQMDHVMRIGRYNYCTISINSDRGVTCDHLSEILLLDNRLVTSDSKQTFGQVLTVPRANERWPWGSLWVLRGPQPMVGEAW